MTRPELIARLLQLAGQEYDFLVNEDWEQAEDVRENYDACFELLRESAERMPFSNDDLMLLQRLHSQQARNIQAARVLQQKAASQLAEMAQSRKAMGYAPVAQQRGPRYLDQSA